MLKISTEHHQKIFQQAEKTYPEECCGLLLGTIEYNMGWIKDIHPTPNSWTPDDQTLLNDHTEKELSRHNRFSIDPKYLLQVQKEARNRQLNIIGVYHSHPDHNAIPSPFDQAIAWQTYYYIIVSVRQGQGQDLLCWQLDDHHQFQSVEMVMSVISD
ncbi:MAG: Mov34/MPN/PAD-1 family protein [Microcystaceae cyanobacterium]